VSKREKRQNRIGLLVVVHMHRFSFTSHITRLIIKRVDNMNFLDWANQSVFARMTRIACPHAKLRYVTKEKI
jgi:hypothetical protein